MFTCPICNESLYMSSVCSDCEKVAIYMKMYTKTTVLKALDRCFLNSKIQDKIDTPPKREQLPPTNKRPK